MEKADFNKLLELVKSLNFSNAEIASLKNSLNDNSLERMTKFMLIHSIQELENKKLKLEMSLIEYPLYAVDVAIAGLRFDFEKKNPMEARFKLTRDFNKVVSNHDKKDATDIKFLIVLMCLYLLSKNRLDLSIVAYITNDLAIGAVLCSAAIEDEKLVMQLDEMRNKNKTNF